MLELIKNGVKLQLRDKQWVMFMLLFPIILTSLISYVMSNVYEADVKIPEGLNVYYYGSNASQADDLNSYMEDTEDTVQFIRVDDFQQGKRDMAYEQDVLVEFGEEEIAIYASPNANMEKLYVKMLLKNALNTPLAEHSQGIEVNKEAVKIHTRSVDYYGIVILNMMILYTSLIPIIVLDYDKKENINTRLKLSGIGKGGYFLARILSSIFIGIVIILPVLLFTRFVLDVYWGGQILAISFYLIVFIAFSIMPGVAIYSICKDYSKSVIVLQTIVIPAFSFLGGSYIKLPQNQEGITLISNLSPLKWLNQGTLEAIRMGDFQTLNQSLTLNIALIIVFAIVIYGVNRRGAES